MLLVPVCVCVCVCGGGGGGGNKFRRVLHTKIHNGFLPYTTGDNTPMYMEKLRTCMHADNNFLLKTTSV